MSVSAGGLKELEKELQFIEDSVLRARRSVFGNKMILIEYPGFYSAETMFELREKLSKYFGDDVYVVFMRNREVHADGFSYGDSMNPNYSSVYLATFKTSKVWERFWEICKGFSHGTKCASINLNTAFGVIEFDDKDDSPSETAFKDVQAQIALETLHEQFKDSIFKLALDSIPGLERLD